MQISVSGRHMHVSQDIQNYAHSKATKLTQFFDKIRTVDVIVSKEGLDYALEIIVKIDHRENLVGKDSGPDIKACIDLIVDKLERQITRHKEKTRNHKHHQTGQPEVYPPSDPHH